MNWEKAAVTVPDLLHKELMWGEERFEKNMRKAFDAESNHEVRIKLGTILKLGPIVNAKRGQAKSKQKESTQKTKKTNDIADEKQESKA